MEENKSEDFTDKLLKGIEEDKIKAGLVGISLIGIYSPLLAFMLIGIFAMSTDDDFEEKELFNQMMGYFCLNVILVWALNLVVYSLLTSPLEIFLMGYSRLWVFPAFIGYLFFIIPVLNTFRFFREKKLIIPRVLTIPLNYMKIIKNTKRVLS